VRRRGLRARRVPFAAAAALLAGACVAPPRSRAAEVLEFEAAARGGERVASFTASGGTALHVSAATPPVVVARPPAGSPRERLWVRSSTRGAAPSAPLRVRCGGVEVQAELPATGHRDRFEWTPLELASADSSPDGDVELSLAEASDAELWLDQLAWGDGTSDAPDPAASPRVWRDGMLELRAASGARVFDAEWVQHLLREQYAAVVRLLGRELRGPLLLVALPAAQWPRPGAGAFQQGRAIYLRDDELHLPWRSFAHEIAHVFEEERATALPRFWSEGLACALADEVEARLWDRGVPRARVRWGELLARGDALHRPGDPPPNRALAFATAAADGAAADRRDYEWAGAVVDALAQKGGPGYFARLEALLAAPPAGGMDAAAAAAPFVAAARADCSGLLERAGIPWPRLPPEGVPPGSAAAPGSR
jgi:hypothetical protein